MFKTKIKPFLEAHCVDCHGPEVKKAGLRLDELKLDLENPKALALWIKAHDKIVQGEMPPKKRPRPPQAELDQVTQWLNQQLHAQSRQKQEKEGRVVLRRLNCTEYENTLRDLLGVNVSVKALLPEDNIAAGFDNVSAALEISRRPFAGLSAGGGEGDPRSHPDRPADAVQRQAHGQAVGREVSRLFRRTCSARPVGSRTMPS